MTCCDCEDALATVFWNNATAHYYLPSEPAVLALCGPCFMARDSFEPPEDQQRDRDEDDGRTYADPRDYREGRE